MRIFTDASRHKGEYSWSFVVEIGDNLDEQYGVFKNVPETIQEAEFKTILLAYYYTIRMYSPEEVDIYTDNLQINVH